MKSRVIRRSNGDRPALERRALVYLVSGKSSLRELALFFLLYTHGFSGVYFMTDSLAVEQVLFDVSVIYCRISVIYCRIG